MEGKVKFLRPKGWGFIVGEDGLEYFLSYKDSFDGLQKGIKVSFDINPKWETPRAMNIKIIESVKDEDEKSDEAKDDNKPSCESCGDADDVKKSDGDNYWCSNCEHFIDECGKCMMNVCKFCDYVPSKGPDRSIGQTNDGYHDPTLLTPSSSFYSRKQCNECGSFKIKVRAGRYECQDCGSYQA